MYTQDMTTNLKCGNGAIQIDGTKFDSRAQIKACLKCCHTDSDCRTLEGYYCELLLGGCLPAFIKDIKADAGFAPFLWFP
jgi:hypothetical protein